MNKESIKKRIIYLLSLIPYVFMWIFAYFFADATAMFGSGIVRTIRDGFGMFVFILWCLIGITVFCSIFYLLFFKFRKQNVILISFSLCIVFFALTIVLSTVGAKEFDTFSQEKWDKYPSQRVTMAYDLLDRKICDDFSEQELVDFLGKPDLIVEKGSIKTYQYSDGYGFDAVYFEFENGVNKDAYITT